MSRARFESTRFLEPDGSEDKIQAIARPSDIATGVRAHRYLYTGAAVLFVVSLGVFSYLASVVSTFPGEVTVTTWLQSWRAPWLDSVMKAVSMLGSTVIGAPVVGGTLLIMYLKRRRKQGVLIVAVLVLSYGLDIVIEQTVDRPRPSTELVDILARFSGPSFPSSHVMIYAAFLGMLAVVFAKDVRPGIRRWAVHASLVFVLVAMGVSRIYLGAHWLGDVIAAYAFGAAVVAVTAWLGRPWFARAIEISAQDEAAAISGVRGPGPG